MNGGKSVLYLDLEWAERQDLKVLCVRAAAFPLGVTDLRWFVLVSFGPDIKLEISSFFFQQIPKRLHSKQYYRIIRRPCR